MKPSNQKPILFVALVCLVSVAVASFVMAPMNLVINGKSVPGKTATIDGATYVPLSALKAAGATTDVKGTVLSINMPAAGGANQAVALEGGINDWLFDGIWRFRVSGVTPNDDGRPGWKVHVELRNGTKIDNLALDGSGFDSLRLIMADGNSISPYNIVDIASKGIGQGQSIDLNIIFYDDDGGGRKPDKLILKIQPDTDTKNFLKNQGASYNTADPSFRVIVRPAIL